MLAVRSTTHFNKHIMTLCIFMTNEETDNAKSTVMGKEDVLDFKE